MIVTVTANPALDITYRMDELHLGESHRVQEVHAVGGGKGVNVASVLHLLGYEVALTGPLGGPTGESIARELRARGLDPGAFVAFDGDSRRTVNVVAAQRSTMLNEPGPVLDPTVWEALAARVAELIVAPGPAVLVLSGSLPPGAPEDLYGRLIRATGPGTATIVDATGPALLHACACSPTLVKPNLAELSAATGRDDPLAGAAELRRHGAGDVLVSAGPEGVMWLPAAGPPIRARLDTVLSGNPTGAGDALTAAMAAGIVDGLDPVETLRRGVAWSAAAVLHPLAGHIDPATAADLSPHVVLEEIA